MNHEGKEWVAELPCPACGCYMARHFACNCGEVHYYKVRAQHPPKLDGAARIVYGVTWKRVR